MNNGKGDPILGILGGMGPEATSCLFSKIIESTSVERDQDHIEIIIHNNCKTPDRTQAILHGGPSPLPQLMRSARMLRDAGCSLVMIPCMSAHYFYRELQAAVAVPIVNALAETARYISQQHPSVKRVGLIATTGTVLSNIFQNEFEGLSLHALVPNSREQDELVMEAIYGKEGIKQGNTTGTSRERILQAARLLQVRGAECIVAGCTEVPLVLTQCDLEIPLIDPLALLSGIAVERCRRPL